MDFATIKFDRPEPGIGVVTLSRPDRLNAINLSMVDDLSRLFHDLSRDESVRVLILTGEGRAFCSGADLKDEGIRHQSGRMLSSASDFLVAVQKRYADMVLDMRRIPQPVIAAVNGAAAGGGLCLTLASDVAYACPDAVFIPSFVNIGLSGGELGTSFFLPRAVGKTRAAEILMTGRNVHAAEAERIGLVCRVVDGPRLMDAALETARVMIEKSPMGLRLTKEALNQNMNAPSLEAAVELENRNQSICCCDPGFADAVQKFRAGG